MPLNSTQKVAVESLDRAIVALSTKTIAVDLTPLLPGGENGGAKHATLALLRALAALLPTTSFLLLTRESSHAELDQLAGDYPTIQRMCVLPERSRSDPGSVAKSPSTSTGSKSALTLLKPLARRALPSWLRLRIQAWRQAANSAATRTGFFSRKKVALLFCPFMARSHADPLIPVISVIYDLQYRAYPQFFTPEEVLARQDNFAWACQNADYLVTISEFVRETVLEATNLSPERVITIPLGLLRGTSHPEDRPQSDALLLKYGLRRGGYIFYPANFWEHKNHARLLAALSLYRGTESDSQLKLLCTGAPGPGSASFSEAARGLGLSEWVIYAGYLSSADYDRLLESAFALIFPSLYEGFGIPVLEAFAAGVPVLCSDVTSLPEVAGDAALYFDPRQPSQMADALQRLRDEPGLRDALISRGVQRLRRFDGADRMARQYAQVFARALESRGARID